MSGLLTSTLTRDFSTGLLVLAQMKMVSALCPFFMDRGKRNLDLGLTISKSTSGSTIMFYINYFPKSPKLTTKTLNGIEGPREGMEGPNEGRKGREGPREGSQGPREGRQGQREGRDKTRLI